ncbi:MAG: hypothetical protein ACXITV_10930 [Luteibaculaceae bacterium]
MLKLYLRVFSLINRPVTSIIIFVLALTTGFARANEPSKLTTEVDTTELSDFFIEAVRGIQYSDAFVRERLKPNGQKVTFFGYNRFFLYHRNMTESFPGLAPFERVTAVGDGYREPMLSMTMVARPNGKSSFGTELYVFTPYTGEGWQENDFSTNLGINFYGNFRTQNGNFGIRAGGIHWYNVSPMTMGIWQVLDKFSIFDRTPWEPVNNTERYQGYYKTGVATPGDLRWNNQAFQGIIFNGTRLPHNFDFDVFWGKSQVNGGLPGALENWTPDINWGNVPSYNGFMGIRGVMPSILSGGRLGYTINSDNRIAYNHIKSTTVLDSISLARRSYEVHTISTDFKFGDVHVTGEFGAGNYKSPTYEEKWGESMVLKVAVPEKISRVPFDVQLYQISRNFFNENGEVFTTGNQDIINDIGLIPGAIGAGGILSQVGQLVHNRRGVNVNTYLRFGDLKLNIGWGLAAELEPGSEVLSYVHRINGLAVSRIYNPFPEGAVSPTIFGPYNRQISFFRGVSEIVRTTDVDAGTGRAVNRKYFNAVDLQAKYKNKIFDKEFYIFYLGSFLSAESEISGLPSLNNNTYMFVQYHEFDVYYALTKKFIVTGYLGFQRAQGGRFTEWDQVSGLPRNQFSEGYGLGFDLTIAENTGLYVRQRWFSFEDRSFALDRYRGSEITVELKTFF